VELNAKDLEGIAKLAKRRGFTDIAAYVRELVDADEQQTHAETLTEGTVAAQLRAAGLVALKTRTSYSDVGRIDDAPHKIPG
jgi:hypothetical protein